VTDDSAQARVAVHEDEHGDPDRKTDHSDQPYGTALPRMPPTTKAAKKATAIA
jgi:hypothetical protein